MSDLRDRLVEEYPVDLDEPLPAPAPRRRFMTPFTWGLLAVFGIAAGFYAGIATEKSQVSTSTSRTTAGFAGLNGSNLAGLAGGSGAAGVTGRGQGGQGGGGQGGGGQGTVGQVKLVDGANIYITDAQGNTIKITTSANSRITRSAAASLNDFKAGDTIIVQGARDSDGNIAATAITSSPAAATTTTTRPPGS